MIYRCSKYGKTVPCLGLGTYKLLGDTARKRLLDAFEIGYRYIDTAEKYGNEADIGLALKESNLKREDIYITSKVWHEHLNKEGVVKALNQSLENLGTDYLDQYLIHWPSTTNVPVYETLSAFQMLKEQGKIKDYGVSNFPPNLLNETLDFEISHIQVEYHPFLIQDELLELSRRENLLLTAYSPLAKGEIFETDTIKNIGKKYNKSESQVVLRWLIQQSNIIAIPRSSKKEHIKNNFEIFDFELSREDMDHLFEMDKNKRLIDPEFAPAW